MSSNLKNTQQQVPSAVDNTSIFERLNNISNNYSDYSFINYHYESIQNNNSSHYNDFHSTWGGAILFAISATAVISIIGCCSAITCHKENIHSHDIYSKLEML